MTYAGSSLQTAGSPALGSPLDAAPALRSFSLARHALVAGLKALGVGSGARVLLPEYICRDLLAALHAAGAVPVYYPVDTRLAPALPAHEWPVAAAVLMVNYFGFAQQAAPFEQYRARTGAWLIEDNAHGFLSRDVSGRWLGRRGDAGIFSLRKTFWLDNGAALTLESAPAALPPQLDETDTPGAGKIRLRRALHTLPAGRAIAALAARTLRVVRKPASARRVSSGAVLGAVDENDVDESETVIPGSAAPFRGFARMLAAQDLAAEASRRRALYLKLEPRARALGMLPVFDALPGETVPYGLPVYCDDASALARLAAAEHLDSIQWPDLPAAVAAQAPAHYRRLHLINFL